MRIGKILSYTYLNIYDPLRISIKEDIFLLAYSYFFDINLPGSILYSITP